MVKGDDVFLEHILESINSIQKYCKGVKKSNFSQSQQLQDAVIRRIEIIGEAVKKLSEDLKNKNKVIEWKKIAGMRDILIHDYFGVDVNLVWNTIKKDLPELKKIIKEIYK
jgi:uncharacterized protein with HEPN domain